MILLFPRVLKSFNFPGTAPLRSETIQYLFDICSTTESGQLVNEENRPVADAKHLLELIFGSHPSRREEVVRKVRASEKEKTKTDGDVEPFTGLPLKSFAAKLNSGRQAVGVGPVQLANATDSQKERASELLAVPLRFISRKSRTALAVPSNFDPNTVIPRSNQLPSHELIR